MKILITIFHYLFLPFVFIMLGLSLLIKLNRYYRIHRKNPNRLFSEQRYKYIYKLIKRILYIKNIKIKYALSHNIPDKAVLYAGNHKSNIDPLIMFKILFDITPNHNFIFLSKVENSKKKNVVSKALFLIDTEFIDRENFRQIFQSYKKQQLLLQQKVSIVVFPETTRYFSDDFGEFKSATLRAACDTATIIQPFSIFGSSGKLDSNKQYKKSTNTIYVDFLSLIKPENYLNSNIEFLMENIKKDIKNSYDTMNTKFKNKKEIFIQQKK